MSDAVAVDHLASKFQELKSLAISYKDNKDIEISDLNSKIDDFKNMLQECNEIYENMLDRTAKSLEKIIENTGSASKIQ